MARRQRKKYKLGTSWDTELDIIDKCEYAERLIGTVLMPESVHSDMMYLATEIETEWLGYFTGTVDRKPDGDVTYNVDGMVFPEQEVTPVSVHVTSEIPDTIGVVHSHCDMKAFFSGTDDKYINQNNNFSIVVNNQRHILTTSKLQLPCGAIIMQEVDLKIVKADSSILEQLTTKLTEKVREYNFAKIRTLYDIQHDDTTSYSFQKE